MENTSQIQIMITMIAYMAVVIIIGIAFAKKANKTRIHISSAVVLSALGNSNER
mgnify:CR=1 FL=1